MKTLSYETAELNHKMPRCRNAKGFLKKCDFQTLELGRKKLSSLCAEYGIDTEASPNWSMREIGEQNDMEPYSVFDAIRQLQ